MHSLGRSSRPVVYKLEKKLNGIRNEKERKSNVLLRPYRIC
ncbi:hypothetical protein BH10CYA1_BH10CYA1_47130 [soil metagenome]